MPPRSLASRVSKATPGPPNEESKTEDRRTKIEDPARPVRHYGAAVSVAILALIERANAGQRPAPQWFFSLGSIYRFLWADSAAALPVRMPGTPIRFSGPNPFVDLGESGCQAPPRDVPFSQRAPRGYSRPPAGCPLSRSGREGGNVRRLTFNFQLSTFNLKVSEVARPPVAAPPRVDRGIFVHRSWIQWDCSRDGCATTPVPGARRSPLFVLCSSFFDRAGVGGGQKRPARLPA